MLFMVIERFKDSDLKPVGERFRTHGRMLPEGVEYKSSWMDLSGTRCFQIVEAPNQGLMNEWAARWEDLVEFEIVPVLTSSDFWDMRQK
ncbi:MAG: hypothetical protein DMF68_14200 [Acidobacteria bacterium]|nr:MAG: hypothetical protein DMF68_14200 [Acidobacteriota bacterium]